MQPFVFPVTAIANNVAEGPQRITRQGSCLVLGWRKRVRVRYSDLIHTSPRPVYL